MKKIVLIMMMMMLVASVGYGQIYNLKGENVTDQYLNGKTGVYIIHKKKYEIRELEVDTDTCNVKKQAKTLAKTNVKEKKCDDVYFIKEKKEKPEKRSRAYRSRERDYAAEGAWHASMYRLTGNPSWLAW